MMPGLCTWLCRFQKLWEQWSYLGHAPGYSAEALLLNGQSLEPLGLHGYLGHIPKYGTAALDVIG